MDMSELSEDNIYFLSLSLSLSFLISKGVVSTFDWDLLKKTKRQMIIKLQTQEGMSTYASFQYIS